MISPTLEYNYLKDKSNCLDFGEWHKDCLN